MAALGRSNGRFSTTSQNATTGQIIVTGDFNGDGKVDAITIYPGTYYHPGAGTDQPSASNGQLSFYSGNSDGTFQPPAAAIDLSVTAVDRTLVGDFNGDEVLDLIIPFGCTCPELPPPSGVLFLAGKGDGTFAAPVSLSIPFGAVSFTADVNNDGKLDIVGTNTISLGNGDGTFQQLPLGITGAILAIGNLNGRVSPLPAFCCWPSLHAAPADSTVVSCAPACSSSYLLSVCLASQAAALPRPQTRLPIRELRLAPNHHRNNHGFFFRRPLAHHQLPGDGAITIDAKNPKTY